MGLNDVLHFYSISKMGSHLHNTLIQYHFMSDQSNDGNKLREDLVKMHLGMCTVLFYIFFNRCLKRSSFIFPVNNNNNGNLYSVYLVAQSTK